jgi:hypothetical protein
MNKLQTRALGALAFLAATVGSAHAALPEGVSTAITAYQTDATAAIGLIMAAGVTIWGLMKLASKLGWR